MADVVGCGGLFFQHTGGVPHGVRQVGEQDVVHQLRQSEQIRFTGQLYGLRGGGLKDGVSPAAGGDHRNGELRHPLHFPKFMERPLGVPAASRRGPADLQQPQAVQEVAARQIVGLAQIEIQYLLRGFRLQAQALLLLPQIPLERDGGRCFGDRPQFVAHDKLALDEAQRRGVAHADRGLQGFVKFRQAGAGPLAQGRQRRGEARGFDDVGGRAVHVLFAEQAGGVGQPADGPIALAAAPEVLVPRGRGHARAVTAPAAQVGIRPRRPCRRDLHLGQPLEQSVVLLGGRFRFKRGHMPRAADHGDALEAFLFRLPQRFAHVRFAQGFPPRLPLAAFASGRFGPQRSHGFADGVEQFKAVDALLDHMVPPRLAVAVSGGASEPVERIAVNVLLIRRLIPGVSLRTARIAAFRLFGGLSASEGIRGGAFRCLRVRSGGFRAFGGFRFCMFFRFFQGFLFRRPAFIFKSLVQPELMGDGQIHEAHREGLAQAVPQGLPFRGELGERVEDGAAGIVGSVHEQGHRGAHPGFEHERQHGFPVRRPFDQQAVGLHCFQSQQQAAGAPRPVVADAEKSNGLIRHGEAFCKLLGRNARRRKAGKPFVPNRHAACILLLATTSGRRLLRLPRMGGISTPLGRPWLAPFVPGGVTPEERGIPPVFRRHTHG